MGRPYGKANKSKPSHDDDGEESVDPLLVDNERLERERVALLAQPRTVANQIAHQWISISMLSNLRSLAMRAGDVGQIVALTGAIDKCENALRGLQKNKIDDELEAIVARIERGDEARSILAGVEDDD